MIRVTMAEQNDLKTKQNELKTNLTNELANVLKQATSEYPSGDDLSKESTQTVCNVIEAILIHGLRKAFFLKRPRDSKYPEPNFWPFVSKYTHKAVLDQIASSKQIKNEIGKSRAWVRILLNENTMENYLGLLSRSTAALSKFYEKWAILRDAERMIVLSGYVKGLARLPIRAPFNSSFLNTWTPTPLILAGLMSGKPARLEQLAKHRRYRSSMSMLEDAELAENALESLCDPTEMSATSSYADGSEAYGPDDDQVSVYSHPSMLDGGIAHFPTLDASNNTVLSNPVPEDNALNCDPHQIRVTRRTHRRIRRSSKSSSCESSRSSGNGSQLALAGESQDAKKVGNLESIEIADDSAQRTSSVVVAITRENKENYEQLALPCETKTATVNADKSFESGNELSTSKGSKSSQSDSKYSTASDDVTVSNELKQLVPETRYDPYTLCPEVTVESTEDFLNGVGGDKSETQILRKSSDVEQEHPMSLKDELYLAEHPTRGNSLLGRGWVHHHQKAEFFVDQSSAISSSTSTDSSRNFDVELRSVLDGALNEVVNHNHSDDGTSSDEIMKHMEMDELLQRDDGTLSAASNRKVSTSPEKSEIKVPMNGTVSELSDEKLINVLTTIPREKGLDAQDFRCPACRKSIGPTFASYRKCAFDEKYYCDGCWNKGEESVIPFRLIRSWDVHPRPVCRANMAFIESVRDKAVLRIDKINPKLYTHSHALRAVKFLREKLSLSVMYLFTCRKSVAEDLERRVWPKEYLYSDIHLYSFADLLTVFSGHLEKHLTNLFNFTTEHIRRCLLCSQKGFICEICSSPEVIYPFQLEITSRCLGCFSVYHKDCMARQRCPKCARRERYLHQQSEIASDHLLLDMD